MTDWSLTVWAMTRPFKGLKSATGNKNFADWKSEKSYRHLNRSSGLCRRQGTAFIAGRSHSSARQVAVCWQADLSVGARWVSVLTQWQYLRASGQKIVWRPFKIRAHSKQCLEPLDFDGCGAHKVWCRVGLTPLVLLQECAEIWRKSEVIPVLV